MPSGTGRSTDSRLRSFVLHRVTRTSVNQNVGMKGLRPRQAGEPRSWSAGAVKVYKHLVDATARAISLEREHFGMNTSEGTTGSRFLVVVKDYTGRTYEPRSAEL